MESLHRVFKALADQNRLRILNLLVQDSFCVCEIEQVLRLPQSLISRHLAYLRQAGLVRDRRLGPRVQYSLDANLANAPSLLACLRGLLRSEEPYRSDIDRWRAQKGLCCGPEESPSVASEVPNIQGESR